MSNTKAVCAAAAAGLFLLMSWQGAARSPSSSQNDARRLSANWPAGYLPASPLPESVLLSPPPPSPGSSAEARDIEAAREALALRGSSRWAIAAADADLFTQNATRALACAAGIAIGPKTTPKLDVLLRRSMVNLASSTSAIKRRFQRQRPFMVNGHQTCTPDQEQALRADGSYPSGHSAIGYGWGLILAEVVPERAARIVARGRAFGDSRRICNAHWLSDIEEGRVAAAAMVARLHAEPAFQADIKAAHEELRERRAAPLNCAGEEAALAVVR